MSMFSPLTSEPRCHFCETIEACHTPCGHGPIPKPASVSAGRVSGSGAADATNACALIRDKTGLFFEYQRKSQAMLTLLEAGDLEGVAALVDEREKVIRDVAMIDRLLSRIRQAGGGRAREHAAELRRSQARLDDLLAQLLVTENQIMCRVAGRMSALKDQIVTERQGRRSTDQYRAGRIGYGETPLGVRIGRTL